MDFVAAVVRLAAEDADFAVVFAAALAAGLVVDFFFVVDVCGDGPPAHAPMARAADKATESGTTIRCKNPVYTLRARARAGNGKSPTLTHGARSWTFQFFYLFGERAGEPQNLRGRGVPGCASTDGP